MKPDKMRFKKVLLILIPLLLLAMVVLRLKSNKSTADQKVYHYDKMQPVAVSTETIVLQPVGGVYSFTGTFEPNRESKLSAEQQGKIIAIYADAGSYVIRGQKLVQLDNSLLQQQLNAIDIQIQNATTENKVQLAANQIQIDALTTDVQRFRILAKADAIQGVQLERAEQQLAAAENQRIALQQQAGIKNAVAQRRTISEQISKTTVYAPFSGYITARLSEVGAFAAPGIPLLQLTEISTLKFTVNVAEKDLPYFKMGQQQAIQADVLPGRKLQARVSMIGSKSNSGSSFPIQFTVQNLADNSIKAGMFGRVEIADSSHATGIIIPSSAIVGTAEQPQVYTVKNGKAVLTTIVIAKHQDNKVVVMEGLREGDLIVTRGLINLFEGANIKTQ